MVSSTHEALVELIRQRPGFAVQLLTEVAGVAVPEYSSVEQGSLDLSQAVPAEYRADEVITVRDGARAVLGVIAEVQLHIDLDKRFSWPAYLVALRNRLRAPAVLLVIATSEKVARWAAKHIELGAGSVVAPIVMGPGVIPVITDPVVARAGPELAMLSAMSHPEDLGVLDALLATFTSDIEHNTLYADLVWTLLPAAARTYLEHRMATTSTWQYQSPFARKYFGEGKAEGKAEDVLTVVSARGIAVPDDARDRITACTDPEQLSAWLINAVTATEIDDVFR